MKKGGMKEGEVMGEETVEQIWAHHLYLYRLAGYRDLEKEKKQIMNWHVC